MRPSLTNLLKIEAQFLSYFIFPQSIYHPLTYCISHLYFLFVICFHLALPLCGQKIFPVLFIAVSPGHRTELSTQWEFNKYVQGGCKQLVTRDICELLNIYRIFPQVRNFFRFPLFIPCALIKFVSCPKRHVIPLPK